MCILNGSPNKNGHSMRVAKALFHDIDVLYHVYDLAIHPCDDCQVCHSTLHCKFDDDMRMVLSRLQDCEHLVMVSPIYFGALSDQLLKLINRFQMLFETKFTHQKAIMSIPRITLVCTCGANDETMFVGAQRTLDILKTLFQAREVTMLGLKNTDTIEDILSAYKEDIEQYKKSVNPH